MTTFPFSKKDQTKSASKLFSGVSAAALILGLSAVTARAAGTIITTTVSAVSVSTGQSLDFIDINAGTVTNDVTNNGTVGLTTNAIGIQVRNGGTVGGQIVNNTSALIQASATGIFIGSATGSSVAGGINNQGVIKIANTSTAVGLVFGINVTGAAVSTTILNNGTISASVAGPTNTAAAGTAIGINISSTGSLQASITNSGFINVDANFDATSGGQTAIAIGVAGTNTAPGSSPAAINFTNNGNLDIDAFARETQAFTANAFASAVGVALIANGTSAANIIAVSAANSSSGTISVNATAFAGTVDNTANATATARGVFQLAVGGVITHANLINNGSIDLGAQATAVVTDGLALALANAFGVSQNATGTGISISVNSSFNNNTGATLSVNANALATALFTGTGSNTAVNVAGASAHATGVNQFSRSVTQANVVGSNSGAIDVSATALAQASAIGAQASATAFGFNQGAFASTGGSVNLSASNAASGSMNINAGANVVGTSSAVGGKASATAIGVRQVNNSTNQPNAAFNFSNSGSMSISAIANASGGVTSNTASALAAGYGALAGAANQTMTLNVGNSGTLNVKATANATNAVASAVGFFFNGAVLTGTVTNAGTVNVTASAPSGNAEATGFSFNGDVNNITFTNTGNINVLAIGSTTATGVKFALSEDFTATNTVTPGTADAATFTNNGGTITAWVNNGGTLSHGNAINTVDAPNPVNINLEGGGAITGNILISDDDNILVRNGSTFFDGQVNGASTLVGNLSVAGGGTLSMMVGLVSSEANVYVDTYTQTSTGTLSFNITPATTKLGMIHANVANLDGTVNVNIAPGLYTNTTFSDIVSASTLNGTWANVTTNTNSAFLSLTALYPGDGTADLVLTRNAFNSLGGLTMNQLAASTGLENSYNINLTGAYGALVQDLLFMSAGSYQSAVEQLHGAEHSQNMQSLLRSFGSLNAAISDRVNVGPYRTRGEGGDIIQRGDLSFWASASRGWGDNDGDVEAPGFDQDVNAYHAGIDFAAGRNAIFGFAAGYYQNDLDFTNGNTSRSDGVQLAVYGHYDLKDYYLRGVIGYGMYDAESRRSISVANTVGTATGLYDIKVFSVHGEFGRRFEVNPNVFVTPYAAFDYADVKMDAFTETGAGGANLSFADNKVSAFAGDLGVRFSTAVNVGNGGLFIPEFSVAWQHDFSDNRIALNTAFAGAANSSFQVVSSNISSDSILVNAGLTFATAGGLEFKAEYNGRFNSQYKESSVGIRLSLLFGN